MANVILLDLKDRLTIDTRWSFLMLVSESPLRRAGGVLDLGQPVCNKRVESSTLVRYQ